MLKRSSLGLLCVAALSLASAAACASAAAANEPAARATLDAAVRALGFLESGPRDGGFVIAVVYAPDAPGGRAAALEAVARMRDRTGPRRSRVRAEAYTVDELLATTDRIDAVLLAPGAASSTPAIADFIRQRRIVSVSSDPACLDADCCVLMVDAGDDVEIVLNTELASRVGAQFSTVFTMMVTRR